jgi:hypothetical protein
MIQNFLDKPDPPMTGDHVPRRGVGVELLGGLDRRVRLR